MAHWEIPSVQVDAEGARAFVLAHGTSRDKARLDGILLGTAPRKETVAELEALQNSDGGFPLRQRPGNPSSIDTTCYMLAQLKDMPPLAGSPMASRSLAFLRRSQRTDGSWSESPAVVELSPHWAASTDNQSLGYLSANACYTLATMEREQVDPIRRAVMWLRQTAAVKQQDANAYAQTLCMVWAVELLIEGHLSHSARAAFEHLRKRTLDTSELGWWLSCALEVGAGGPFLVPIVRGLSKLVEEQQVNGAWPAEEGFVVESTLMSLRVLRGYGLI